MVAYYATTVPLPCTGSDEPLSKCCESPADLLREWGVTTLPQWLALSPEKRRQTVEAAINLPYADTLRNGRYEQSRRKPGRGE